MIAAPRLLEQAGTGRRYIRTDALAARADMTEVKPAPVAKTAAGAPLREPPPKSHKKKPVASGLAVPDPDATGEETPGDLG